MNKVSVLLFALLISLSCKNFATDLTLESPAFSANSMIPGKYTCDGANQSPPLSWKDSSTETQSYVLLVDDPDASGGTWNHWVLFNIPASIKQLNEGALIPPGAISGKNSWNGNGYNGPCPPSGTHRYFFKLYALNTLLNLNSAASENEVMVAMREHLIASSELIGLYQKK
ncbi:YbhB/YbcL family Raf kinase inhibitor-like protein [Legionella fallonii]|uniref:YbhB/YbcL family Raf kinase inhibitor-like protein n=1 Tax=Legionella fallonii LLAP-10 TaxID=1212491 RepID=A0A098G5D7_9GAMM|nr:YbhB/YbcL family Raf kinase inhibitor-like protein [Legionella fallonii]CEG57672.1 conserved exported protein of unknown function [Legionella fallonii LLAP-10]